MVFRAILTSLLAGSIFFAALPATTNYELNSYGFGSGGTGNSSTSNYSLEGMTGEATSQADSTSTYNLKPGYVETQQANVPKVTLTNPSNYYDKLHFVIDQQNNPGDAKYALQVCVGADWTPNCGGTTLYVKADNTLGATLTTADYQIYTAWGGAGGANIIGLSPGTTYYVRAKATQGQFTESGYGPSANAATSAQSISFCLYTGGSCGSGNSVSLSGLVAGTVTTGSSNIGVDFATNADSGGSVYIYSSGSLTSSSQPGSPITSATADLSSAPQGYGVQVSSVASLTALSPYNGSGNSVGALNTVANTILDTAVPIASGSAAIQLQAKVSSTTLAASDYADTITVIAAARF